MFVRNAVSSVFNTIYSWFYEPTEIPAGHSSVLAVRSGNKPELSKYTLYRDFNPNVYIDNGSTLLLTAIDANQPGMAMMLLNHNANPNQAAKDGRLPLEAARMMGNEQMIMMLLQRGAKDAAELRQVQAVQSLPQGTYMLRRLTTESTTTTNRATQEEMMVVSNGNGQPQYQQPQPQYQPPQMDPDELRRLQRMGWNTKGRWGQDSGSYRAVPMVAGGGGMYVPQSIPKIEEVPQQGYQSQSYSW